MPVQPLTPTTICEQYKRNQSLALFNKVAVRQPAKRPKEEGKGDQVDVSA